MKTVFIVAGGTGGHVFPALALAHELQQRGIHVECFGDKRTEKYYRQQNFACEIIQSSAWSTTLPGKVKAAWKILSGMVHSADVIREYSPFCVVGFGGYPSFPTLRVAQLLKIPTILHEQNAVFGRANRSLAKYANDIALSFDNTKSLPVTNARLTVTGNPVRASFTAQQKPFKAPKEDKKFRLLIFAGSQGSTIFSTVLPAALAKLDPALRARLALYQQTRFEDADRLTQAYATLQIKADIQPFYNDIIQQYQKAHLVIARAGASTVTELTALGRPSILVPLAASLDGDQAQNAAHLVAHDAAWMMTEKDFTPEALAAKITALMHDPAQLEHAAQAAQQLGRPRAASNLADLVMTYL